MNNAHQGSLLELLDTPRVELAADLASYDYIVVNTSAGKDSQAMLDYVVEHARAAGVADRIVAVHCDLGRVEWAGTLELAAEQAAHYGVRFEVVRRELGDLLDQVVARRASLDAKAAAAEAAGDLELAETKRNTPAWPSSDARYCTSDQKTSQVKKLLTRLGNEGRAAGVTGRPVRILNCLGLRAEESTERAKRSPLVADAATNTLNHVDRWHPILDWTVGQVWARIAAAGTRSHDAYALGMSRLSCAFCVFASRSDLQVAGKANRALLDEYVAVELKVGHRFTMALSAAELADSVDAELEAAVA